MMVAFFLLAEKKDECCGYLCNFRKTLGISLYRHYAMFILTFPPTSCTICITNIDRESFHVNSRNIFSKKYITWGINSNLPFRGEYKFSSPETLWSL